MTNKVENKSGFLKIEVETPVGDKFTIEPSDSAVLMSWPDFECQKCGCTQSVMTFHDEGPGELFSPSNLTDAICTECWKDFIRRVVGTMKIIRKD